jgi:hypothetical protein
VTQEPHPPDGVVLRFSPEDGEAAVLFSRILQELENGPLVMVEIDGVRLRISRDVEAEEP